MVFRVRCGIHQVLLSQFYLIVIFLIKKVLVTDRERKALKLVMSNLLIFIFVLADVG
jgi:hypothetical protein